MKRLGAAILHIELTFSAFSKFLVNMGRYKDLSDSNKGQIVIARWLGQSISDMARFVRCSQSVMIPTNSSPRRKKHDRQTRCSAAKTHQYKIWMKAKLSDTNEQKSYWEKSQMNVKCHNIQYIEPCCNLI